MNIRQVRILSLAAAAVATILVVVAALILRPDPAGGRRGVATIGGPFTLIDQDGKTRSDADFRGELMLIYFGYTNCPDVCPTALNDMGRALDRLGAAAIKVRPVFITIDPARDTPQRLKPYTESFHSRMVGLTGSTGAIARAAKAYRVYHAKAGDPDATEDYLMEHNSIVFLMGADGSYLTHFGHGTPPDKMAAGIRKHLP